MSDIVSRLKEAWDCNDSECDQQWHPDFDELERELSALQPKWSREPPTKPGLYWVNDGYSTSLVQLRHADDTLVYDTGYSFNARRMDNYGLWAGPIDAPPLPEAE